MSIDPPRSDSPASAQEEPFDPKRERERILGHVAGRKLDAHQAELVCATLAMLAEMEAGR